MTQAKLQHLQSLLSDMQSVAIAFSGGVDSSFLLKVAHDVLGEHCIAVTADSASLARSELDQTKQFTRTMGVTHVILSYQETQESESYTKNPLNRCFYCKDILFSKLKHLAQQKGIAHILEGSNASDVGGHRPGMQAARDHHVRSPLQEVGLTKDEIRTLSKSLGLSTWDKPEMACLASRIPHGQVVSIGKLNRIDQAEAYLKKHFDVSQLRVRHDQQGARIETDLTSIPLLEHIKQQMQEMVFLSSTMII